MNSIYTSVVSDGVSEYYGENGKNELVKRHEFFAAVENVEAVRVIGDRNKNFYIFIATVQHPSEMMPRKILFRLNALNRDISCFELVENFDLNELTPFELRKMFYSVEGCLYLANENKFTLRDKDVITSVGNRKKPYNIKLFTWAGGAVFAWHDGEKARFVFIDDTEEKRGEAVFCSDELTEDNILLWRVEHFARLGNGVNVGPGEMSIRLKSVIFPNK